MYPNSTRNVTPVDMHVAKRPDTLYFLGRDTKPVRTPLPGP